MQAPIPSRHNRPLQVFALLCAFWIMAACGRSRPTPTATPSPTPTPTPSVLNSAVNTNLIALAPSACDGSEGVDLKCSSQNAVQRVETRVAAGAFARWSLRLPETKQPLTGNEVLALHVRRTGDLAPNLYLVEASGQRIYIRVAPFGLQEEWRTLHIPLREIKDEEGKRPDFAQVTELQLVFEWADMAGVLEFDDLRFLPVWTEKVPLPDRPEEVQAPPGFVVDAIAGSIHNPTQLEAPSRDVLWVSEQAGRIWRYEDRDGDGRFEIRTLWDTGYTEIVGLLYDPLDGAVWLGGRGQLWRTADSDDNGAADVRELRIDGLPWGRHQNNGLEWNPVEDPFSGEAPYTWLYFGLGSQGDLDGDQGFNAKVLRFPRDGQGQEDIQIVSQGNRNTYDLVWAEVSDGARGTVWALFASENGPDFNDAPDEVNHIRWGHHYGFPEQFGPVPSDEEGQPYSGPIYPVAPHASADGLAYVTNPAWPDAFRTLYVALFGEIFSPEPVGHTVDRILLTPLETPGGLTFRGEPSVFLTGLERPLALTTDVDGNLLAADYVTGIVYRVRFAGE